MRHYIFFCSSALALILFFMLVGCGSKTIKKAEDYINAGMYEQAAQLLQLEVNDNPKNAKAHYLLGVALLSMKHVSLAQEEFNRAILLDTSYRDKVGEAYFRAAMALLDKEDISTAREFLEEAVKQDPNMGDRVPKTLFDRAVEIGKKEPESSKVLEYFILVKHYDSRFNEKIAEFCFGAANSLFEKGSLIKAMDYADASVESDPKYLKEAGSLLYRIGIQLFKQGKVDLGQIALRKAVQKYPQYSEDSPDFLYYMAEYFHREREFGNAIRLLKLFVDKYPHSDHLTEAKERLERYKRPANVAMGKTSKIIAEGPDKVNLGHGDRRIYGKDEMENNILTDGSLNTWIGWIKDSYDKPFKVTVTIDLGDTYVVKKIRYNMGNVQRAETWNADKMITPFGEVRTNPGRSHKGAWTEQTGLFEGSSISITFAKTRVSWPTDWMCIGEIEIYATPK